MKFLWLIIFCSTICSATPPKKDHRLRAALYTTSDTINPYLFSAIKQRAADMYNVEVVFEDSGMFLSKGDSGWCHIADVFTDKLAKKKKKQFDFAMLLTDVDLIRIHCFQDIDEGLPCRVDTVLGYTNQQKGTCVISAFRKEMQINSRITNVVMHEMGHLVGLTAHCENMDCLMIRVDNLDNDKLCERCKRTLAEIQQERLNKKDKKRKV